MTSYMKKGMFDDFFEKRSSLIVQFKDGVITKKEFVELNYDLVRRMHLKPFLKVDSYERGMYNYQYYNVLAKYYTNLGNEVKNTRRHQRYYTYYSNKGNNYYNEKDKAALNLIKFLEFKGIEAYFISVESKSLRDKLYEIVLLDYEEAIFHSKSIWLLEILRKEGVFIEEEKISLIDGYINETY